jgi:poly(3-hydroxybutyrate) depolymerase
MSSERLIPGLLCVVLMSAHCICAEVRAQDSLPTLTETSIDSSMDGKPQPIRYWVPEDGEQPRPLLVFLHSWSGDYTQDNSKWQREAVKRGWIYVHPNFRGVNNSVEACGSRLARQDILDAVDFACKNFTVDPQRIYLAGTSGGGHMAMLMAGHHPDRFAAVSAWVGISDLADWYQFHVKDDMPQKYARMILQSLGGRPGESDQIDAEYRDRSPIHHLHRVGQLPIDINAGVKDGISGSVPIRHSLNAFNVIAKAHGAEQIAESDIAVLWETGRLPGPLPQGEAGDKTYSREVLLRRTSGNARVTIFDGGHESLPFPACEWLAAQSGHASADR